MARELGLELDLSDVAVTPMVPAELLDIDDPVAFISALKQQRGAFAARIDALRAKGQVLRYLAVIDPSTRPVLKVEPVAVTADHPAARLVGNQAFVAFLTRRYAHHPLVIQGAGAGGEVTASGVLAEVFRIATGLTGRR